VNLGRRVRSGGLLPRAIGGLVGRFGLVAGAGRDLRRLLLGGRLLQLRIKPRLEHLGRDHDRQRDGEEQDVAAFHEGLPGVGGPRQGPRGDFAIDAMAGV